MAPSASRSEAVGAAPSSADTHIVEEHVDVFAVLDGPLRDVRGNQHRLQLQTDRSLATWPGSNARLTSYFCPRGARITMVTTSSRCVLRRVLYLRYDRSDYRVSSTMRSAVVDGAMESGGARLGFDLTLFAQGSRTSVDHGTYVELVWPSRARGRIDDAVLRADPPGERNAMISRTERV